MAKILVITALVVGMVGVSKNVQVMGAAESDVFQSCQGKDNEFCQNVQANQSDFELVGANGIITKVGQIIVWLVGTISILMVVVGGFKYAISGGDASSLQSAKNTIMYALIGLGVAIFAQAIVSFVLTRLL